MKKLFTAMLLLAVVLATGGCSKETPAEQGEGQVAFEVGATAQVAASDTDQTRANRELPVSVIPAAANFSLTITTPDGALVNSYDSFSDYNQPLLQHGDYKVRISSGDPLREGPSACHFEGGIDFKVVARKTVSYQIKATLANSAVSLTTTEWFRKYYTSATLTIRTTNDYKESFHISSTGDSPFFAQPGSQLFLKGSAIKTNGAEVQFPETLIGTTKARTWHTIIVDMGTAAKGSITIQLDDTMTEIPEQIELNPEA